MSRPGGDYVGTTDGLTDCDGHGTLVAGIIAGQPGDDGFSGVAPGGAAAVASGRPRRKFSPRTAAAATRRSARAIIDIASLARAIVHAADLGARVINISAVTCLPADHDVDQTALGAALRYAAVDKDAVIVAAAGNTGPTGSVAGGTACESNPLTDLAGRSDPRNWAGVTSVSVPSWWQPYVLSVGVADRRPGSRRSSPWPGRGWASPRPARASCRSATATTAAWPTGCPTTRASWCRSAAPATPPPTWPAWRRWCAVASPT